jgi:hypothetical protein
MQGMDTIGVLKMVGGRYEFRSDAAGMTVRGDYAEWVLSAAAEMMEVVARRETEGKIDELETLCEFGEADPVELDSARYDMRSRFEVLPQCTVSMGDMDYRWVAPEGRERLRDEFDGHPMKRVHDMALTRNDSFLENENGVDTSGN